VCRRVRPTGTEDDSDDVTHKQNISKEQCICLAKILQYIHQIVVRTLCVIDTLLSIHLHSSPSVSSAIPLPLHSLSLPLFLSLLSFPSLTLPFSPLPFSLSFPLPFYSLLLCSHPLSSSPSPVSFLPCPPIPLPLSCPLLPCLFFPFWMEWVDTGMVPFMQPLGDVYQFWLYHFVSLGVSEWEPIQTRLTVIFGR